MIAALIYGASVLVAWSVFTQVILRRLADGVDPLLTAVILLAPALVWPVAAPVMIAVLCALPVEENTPHTEGNESND